MQIAGVAAEQLFVDFANSEWYDGRGRLADRLLDHAWRARFLREWDLGDPGVPSRATLRRLMLLREVLRGIVEEAFEGRSPSTSGLEDHAADLPSIPMHLAISADSPIASWVVRSPSWAHVEAEVIRSCLGFVAGPARGRLRRCENEGCLWAFVDLSRNGSRRWCDPRICGNVAKVRAYRQRQQAGKSSVK
jgi:predicted RNA-binding Zn ribbon-like protein